MGESPEQRLAGDDMAQVEKTGNTCPICESYAKSQAKKPIAIMCCEGACLRGEIAREASNRICHKLISENTGRTCLGGAFTKDTGQRNLVRNAWDIIGVEGSFLELTTPE